MLQCRNGKRTGPAAVKMAVDMVAEKMIKKEEALLRVKPDQLDQLLHPQFEAKALKSAKPLASALNASPGAGCGQIVFTADEAVEWDKAGKKAAIPVMDFLYGRAIELEVTPGPDDPRAPERKTRETSYSTSPAELTPLTLAL